MNANFDVRDTQFGSGRFQTVSRSTRIAEVENADSPNEHEKPVGNDHGYMWRLYTYWRIEEKDGGVYVQNESVSLSRTVPALLAFVVNPLVKSIPRNVLIHLLTDTRNAVEKARGKTICSRYRTTEKRGNGSWWRGNIRLGGYFVWEFVRSVAGVKWQRATFC